MGLAISDKDIEQARQALFAAIDHLRESVEHLGDEFTIEIDAPVKITFKRTPKP